MSAIVKDHSLWNMFVRVCSYVCVCLYVCLYIFVYIISQDDLLFEDFVRLSQNFKKYYFIKIDQLLSLPTTCSSL